MIRGKHFAECQCNNHATSCVYNATLGHGECKNCIDNTHGVKCELCKDMFYRNAEQPISHPDTCLGELFPGALLTWWPGSRVVEVNPY